ncbi:TIGR01777 family oxidoreductase [Pasteuria penetrans]|uniref:TIGR01777 family oxidoreductase n=1 Tax=Pasteuria penetrans TaxID=86005 RepID=UPI0011F0242E|nr:TIGR01777 family oxidoreductase [Pasteuria penetrans]
MIINRGKDSQKPLRIAITGSTGLVGTELMSHGKNHGHTMIPIVRCSKGREYGIPWDPEKEQLNPEDLEGCDVLIHLAGENIGAHRWTTAQKEKIHRSRWKGTNLLANTLCKLQRPPSVWLSASAIGYYGTGKNTDIYTESSPPPAGDNDDFLSRVVRDWETATKPAMEAGIRTVWLRFGVILSTKGGALRRMLPLFRCGLGGRMGTGKQIINWWSLSEIPDIVEFLIRHKDIQGPVNIVSPDSCPQLVFAEKLAKIMQRPSVVPTPAIAMQLVLGEMAGVLLKGGTILPKVLQNRNYRFRFPKLHNALSEILAKRL